MAPLGIDRPDRFIVGLHVFQQQFDHAMLQVRQDVEIG